MEIKIIKNTIKYQDFFDILDDNDNLIYSSVNYFEPHQHNLWAYSFIKDDIFYLLDKNLNIVNEIENGNYIYLYDNYYIVYINDDSYEIYDINNNKIFKYNESFFIKNKKYYYLYHYEDRDLNMSLYDENYNQIDNLINLNNIDLCNIDLDGFINKVKMNDEQNDSNIVILNFYDKHNQYCALYDSELNRITDYYSSFIIKNIENEKYLYGIKTENLILNKNTKIIIDNKTIDLSEYDDFENECNCSEDMEDHDILIDNENEYYKLYSSIKNSIQISKTIKIMKIDELLNKLNS